MSAGSTIGLLSALLIVGVSVSRPSAELTADHRLVPNGTCLLGVSFIHRRDAGSECM